jgi:hypothetical protein
MSIHSGLLGPEAKHGGFGAWLLGLSLHYLIAMSIAAIHCLCSRRLTFLVSYYFICGLSMAWAPTNSKALFEACSFTYF